MADVLTAEQRRLNMSNIRGKDTKPEMLIRSGLHKRGLRYKLHAKDLPGRPDLVFKSGRAAIFVNGCFWHGHDCALFKEPATRESFWREKIAKNVSRDQQALECLHAMGWRTLSVWECALKGRNRISLDDVLSGCERFIASVEITCAEISGLSPERREQDRVS